MNDQRHEEVWEMIPAYVLGAVPAEEMPLIRAHILSCDECMAEADRFADTTSALALSVDAAPLPAGLTERIMAAATGSTEAVGAPIEIKRRRFALRWSLVPTAAFLALVLAVVAVSVSLRDANEAIDRQERAIAAIIQGHRGIDMRGPDAVATLVPTDSGSLFVASGLDDAPDDKTYQLWLIDGEVPTSAGTFDVEDGLVMFETSKTITGFTGAAVTIEPDGGSPGPTGVQVVNSFS